MFLKKFIFINWGNIPNIEFEMGPVNLLSGGSGSGKTTVGDAIQTIMTAAHENLFQYNPGQDETTQRGRGGKKVRTLASYVLGCDDGSYARPYNATDGYLAAVFHPTPGETAEPFTAVIAVRAWLDNTGNQMVARQDDLLFLILPGEQLSLKHFVREDKSGKYVVPLDRLNNLLIEEFGKSHVEKYDSKKRSYLRRLYAVLQGRSDSVSEMQAMNAAKAFSRFMAYKPVQSINKFVSDEILEKKDLGEAIRSISGQLKTIHSMERDANQLVRSIEILQQAEKLGVEYINQWIEKNTLDYTLAMHTHHAHQQTLLLNRNKRKIIRHQVDENEAQTADAKQRLTQVHAQLVQLEAQRQGVPALNQKDELENNLNSNQAEMITTEKQLMQQNAEQQSNLQQIESLSRELQTPALKQQLPQFSDMQSMALFKETLQQAKKGDVDILSIMQKDLTSDLGALEQHLDHVREAQNLHNRCFEYWYPSDTGDNPGHFELLSSEYHNLQTRYKNLSKQRTQKQEEIERLENQNVIYPHFVQKALDAIKLAYPQADPRVLCDHIEVKDEKWQMSIEGYLGGNRFSILVNEDYEAEAISLIRKLPGRDNRAKIIQGSKARRDSERVSKNRQSIVQVLEFSHSTAMHYITSSYASVLMVGSTEELKSTARGITAEGLASGGYSMWRCDLSDADLVFGVAARKRALIAKQKELKNITQDWQQQNDLMQQVGRVQDNVRALKKINYAETLSSILVIQREIQKIKNLLTQLDLSEHEELESKLDELKALQESYQNNHDALIAKQTHLSRDIQILTTEIEKLSGLQEKDLEVVETCEQNLRDIAKQWSEFDVDKKLDYADSESKKLNEQAAINYRESIESELRVLEKRFSSQINNHNEQCMPSDEVVYDNYFERYDQALFITMCKTHKQLDTIYNRLKNNILVEKHEKLSQLKDSFNNAFVTHLCHTIHQAVSSGKRQIELLNKELQGHKFGADQESFRFDSEWVSEYREYARFFDDVIKQPTLGEENNLFNMELSEKSEKVRNQLMKMLLDEDEKKALKELERIADYRNYRRYEIYKEVGGKEPIALSEYGTGSGGQLETPAYIIRSAAVTSAFRFSEGVNHLRMVLVDEAFSKMDEPRSREVIDYLTRSLGLQLIFIMPSSKSGPFMDLISNEFVFAKCPSDKVRGQLKTRVLVDRKQCNTEKIKMLWANHRRSEQIQAEMDFMEEFEDA
jgi:energy-coupling factor transporter ATP-binding protein EcfA2